MSTPALPPEGAAFAVPLENGRWSVCRVLRPSEPQDHPAVLVASSSWVGEAPPDPSDPALRPLLTLTHHSWEGQANLAWMSKPPPERFAPIGSIEPTPEERALPCSTFGYWEHFAVQPLMQWRWDHEREAVLVEDEANRQRELQHQEEVQQAREAYLEAVTLQDLLYHPFFASWEEFVDAKDLAASRAILQSAVADLLALGRDSPEGARLAVLQACIESFNELDAEREFIFTIESEDICEAFEEIVHAAGLGHHEDLADQWRDW